MKKNNLAKKLSAVLLAGAMAASMSTGVFADGGITSSETGVTSVAVGKTVTTDGNTYAPNTTFTFAVATGNAGSYDDNVVYEGVDGGLTGTTITSAPGEAVAESYSYDGTLAVDASVFPVAGVYHYVVTETEGSYEGITYDSSSYDVYLYVLNGENGLYVAYAVSVKDDEKADLSFTNDYGKTSDTTHDVTVKKVITGNQANPDAKFNFDVTVTGAEGEKYKVVAAGTEYSIVSGGSLSVSLGNNNTVTIYGLSANDEYSVKENDETVAANGYTVYDDKDYEDDGVVSGKAAEDAESYTVTNTKDATTPTGLVMSYAPYILIVAVAAALGFLFLRRKAEI